MPLVKRFTLVFWVAFLFVLPISSNATDDIYIRHVLYLNETEGGKLQELSHFHLDGFQKAESLLGEITEPIFQTSLLTDFEETYPVPDMEYLSYFGRGLTKEQAKIVEASTHAFIIDCAYSQAEDNNNLRKLNLGIQDIAIRSNAFIFDSATRELFTPDAWQEYRINAWSGETPLVEKHITIHAYKNTDYVRAITLGMEKFGLPDVVVNDFSWSDSRSIGNLINIVTQQLVEAYPQKHSDRLEVRISALEDTPFKLAMMESLIEGYKDSVLVGYRDGQWEEGDPQNTLLELTFDHYPGKNVQERQVALVSELFGSEDAIVYISHTEAIEAASQEARAQLGALKKRFSNGLDAGEYIQVKAPFETSDGGTEWMWVEIIQWKGNKIKGLLKNQPFHVPDLKAGSIVAVKQKDVFDYLHQFPDGRSEGNKTGKLIQEMQAQ